MPAEFTSEDAAKLRELAIAAPAAHMPDVVPLAALALRALEALAEAERKATALTEEVVRINGLAEELRVASEQRGHAAGMAEERAHTIAALLAWPSNNLKTASRITNGEHIGAAALAGKGETT